MITMNQEKEKMMVFIVESFISNKKPITIEQTIIMDTINILGFNLL
jgi:hypothetical protein